MQGDLLYAAWVDSELHRIELAPDGQSVVSDTTLATGLTNVLDVAVGPDGTIYAAEYGANRITFFRPNEAPVSSISVTGVLPNTGPVDGGQAITITGTNFTNAGETTVEIYAPGFPPQEVTNLVVENSTTMTAVTPPNTAGAKNVVVSNSIGSATLTNGYTYVVGGGTVPPVADAGDDWSGPIAHDIHAHVTLDARGSFDPDGFIPDPGGYVWREGSTILSTNIVDSVQFTEGLHIVTLEVTDNDGYTDTDEVRVTVTATAENPLVGYCFDVNGDAYVTSGDMLAVAQSFGAAFTSSGYVSGVYGGQYTILRDWNADRVVNSGDILANAIDQLAYPNGCPLVDQQIRVATGGMEQYQNIQAAQAAGYFQITPYIPGQGRHMMRLGSVPGGGVGGHDLVLEPNNPEALLYEPDPTVPGGWRLGGAMYIIPTTLTTIPPEGFATNDDAWHYHEDLCIWNNGNSVQEFVPQATCEARPGFLSWSAKAGWLLHLWNFVHNPVGRFVEVAPGF
jgi:hypothetical protein